MNAMQPAGPFFFKLVEPPPIAFCHATPGLTRFHVLTTTLFFPVCLFCRIAVTSPPALYLSIHLCLTRARQRQLRLAAAAQQGKKHTLSALWRPQCNPTLLTRENAMSYQSRIPCVIYI